MTRVDLEAFELVLLRTLADAPAYDAELELNEPAVTGIFEQSGTNLYAIANGQSQDEGGPLLGRSPDPGVLPGGSARTTARSD